MSIAQSHSGHILLCGLGKVGFSILELLHDLGEPVVVVAKGVAPDWARRAEALAARLLIADARDEQALRNANVETARAVIIATNDDLANLEIALDTRRIAPQASIVLRLYDERLAERVRRDIGMAAVLNAAALSAPAFVAAALGDDVLRAFDVEDASVNILAIKVRERGPGAGETLRALASRLNVAPLAVRAGKQSHTLAPSLEAILAPGDEVLVAASSHALEALVHQPDLAFGHTHARPESLHRLHLSSRSRVWRRPKAPLRTLLWRIWRGAPPLLRAAFLAIHALLVLGVLLFHYQLGLSWVDSLYFTITTMTTVGFGDINLLGASPFLKLFGCLLMVSGVALAAIFFTIITDYLITRRFEEALGKPQTTFRDHVIVVGMGNLGQRVATRLHELGEPVIVIERESNREFITRLPKEIPVLIGDALQPDMMEQAGVERARAVLALTNEDMANMRIAHLAEDLQPDVRTVVRLFNSSLAGKLGSDTLGIDQALNPSQAAAATFVACALAPDVVQGFTIGARLLMLRWLDPARRTACAGRTVRELREQEGILVLLRHPAGERGLRDAALDDVIREGDRLVALDEYDPARRAAAACAVELLTESVTAF